MSLLSVAIQTSEMQISQSPDKVRFFRHQGSTHQGLTAKWALEAGKLICYWLPVQSCSNHCN